VSQALGKRDVGGLETFRTLDHVELDSGAFGQGAETAALDGREVDEHVVTVLARDEAESLRVVEPLDVTGRSHVNLLSVKPSEIQSNVLVPEANHESLDSRHNLAGHP